VLFELSWGTSVTIMSDYGLDNRAIEFRSPAEQDNLPLLSVSGLALGSNQPLVQWLPGVFPGGKVRPRSDTKYLPPSSTEVVNE
jgi:hypothetical protein